MHKLITSFLVVLLLAFTTGCLPKYAFHPEELGQSISENARTHLCQNLRNRANEISSLRVLTQALQTDDKGTSALRYAIATDATGRLRIDVLPEMAAYSLATIASDGQGYLLLNMQDKKATYSTSGESLFENQLKIALAPEDLMYILSGRVPLRLVGQLCDGSSHFVSDGHGSDFIVNETLGQQWQLVSGTSLVRSFKIRRVNDRVKALEGDFGDYSETSDKLLPREVNLKVPLSSLGINFTLVNPKINQDLPAELFKIAIPDSFTRESL